MASTDICNREQLTHSGCLFVSASQGFEVDPVLGEMVTCATVSPHLYILSYMYTSVVPVNMSDPIRIRSGSGGKHWPEASRTILVHRLASGPDPFGQNLTQSARTKPGPGWFCTILFGSSVDERG